MHQAAISYGSKHRGKREFVPEHASLEIAIADGNRAARTKNHIPKGTTILS
jgi:hypothetical protein